MMRIGGFHRIGIVLSVAWAIIDPFYVFNDEMNRTEAQMEIAIRNCVEYEEPHNPNIDCAKEGRPYLENRHSDWKTDTLWGLVFIPLGWIAFYLAVGAGRVAFLVGRWILRGFRRDPASS